MENSLKKISIDSLMTKLPIELLEALAERYVEKKLADIKEIVRSKMINKYICYDSYAKIYNYKNPQLVDAILTESDLPYAKSTFEKYTKDIEQDIKLMIKLMPETMSCAAGTLRCRDDVPPLALACVNKYIPIEIIEYMLENGADIDQEYYLNNTKITIKEDLYRIGLSSDRFTQLEKLFERY